ncbi:NAD(P)/FAD-dependent oxidoreductase [Algicella marina]|uniref:NAD(P)-binding protein n=1 Tax=Algicella marina TaxID=2683284 RepID=A0A6P1T449_9RHOB|nr:FAD-dependent oxidoreductase [Algicella marina]QHQ36480.1 NAD(P)-binding protein [Algicella marina]
MAGIVVVGAGQAGATLVETLRKEGYDGPVTLVGAEQHLPYQRPPLSKKYLLGELEVERLHLRPQSYYDNENIALRLGTRVRGIDRDTREVHFEGGDKLAYDQLALTTGSHARRLPERIGGTLGGVYTVRDLADVDAMAAEVVPGRHVLIVGGGYIGLEAAAVAAAKGLRVTLIEMADRILKRVASAETAEYFRKLHSSHGVEIVEGIGLEKLEGDARVTAALLTDGTRLDVDFAVVGVGIEPSTWLAEAAGLRLENGIAVDGYGRTSDPAIFASGDCCSFPYRGGRIRLESVPHAIDFSEVIAKNMLNGEVEYVAKPWFWSDQYDVKLQIAGLNTGFERVVTRSGAREGSYSCWYFKGLELLAVDAMNDPKAYMTGKRWIEAGVSPEVESLAAGADFKEIPTA